MKWYPGLTIKKDPDAVLDWQFDWSSWLAPGECISSYSVAVNAGLTLDSDSNNSTSVTAWLSGGVAGSSYTVTVSVVTDNVPARKDDKSITILVVEE